MVSEILSAFPSAALSIKACRRLEDGLSQHAFCFVENLAPNWADLIIWGSGFGPGLFTLDFLKLKLPLLILKTRAALVRVLCRGVAG